MEKLPPIPTPLRTRWREFRYQFLPIITFSVIVTIVGIMWRNYVVPPNVFAEVEPIAVRVLTTMPGTLVRLDVERYQRVTNGQVLGVVETMPTNLLQAALGVVEGDLMMMKARMGLSETRIEQNYLQELLTMEAERAQLEINKVDSKKAEAEFLRVSNLFHAKPALESEANYDLARFAFYSLATNVSVTQRRLAEKEKLMPLLKGTNMAETAQALTFGAKVQSDQLLTSQRIILRAPLDGTISALSNRVGEAVLPGRPILVVTALESTNILAFARQPLNSTPKIGDVVQVRRQTFQRQVAWAQVIQVGTQLEAIDRPLLANTGIKYGYDIGLPFLVTLPKSLNLSPGERVDVVINPPRQAAAKF
jgi:multidrug resistance efflux pump